MYKGRRILLVAPAYNEGPKIGEVVHRTPREIVDTVLVVDDGSTDETAQIARQFGAEVISLGAVRGVGFALRHSFQYAREGMFDIVVIIAGNNKDSPEEISRLLDPICDDDADFVIGSRYLPGGAYGGDMPVYRKISTRLHPLMVSLVCRKRISESTNGYRAMKVSLLSDPRIVMDQPWLDHYQLEVYLLVKVLKLGYRVAEAPVSKIYPPRQIGNTKMIPVVSWFEMLSPIFLVGFGIRK